MYTGRMREVAVERDGGWLVLVTTRYRRDRPAVVRRTYLSMDEAAQAVVLLGRELPPVTSVPRPSQGP